MGTIALPDVPDVEVAREAVEGVAPRVAQPEADDLRRRARPSDVESQHLPEEALHVLSAILGVAARAPVPGADVEEAVRAEREPAAVVVRVRLVDAEKEPGARGERSRAVRLVPHDARVAGPVRVVHVDEAVRPVHGVEREPEETLLAAGRDRVADVEEEPVAELPALKYANRPALLDDVEAARLVPRRRDLHRLDEPSRDDRAPEDALCGGRGTGHRHDEDTGEDEDGEPHGRHGSRAL